MIRFVIGLDYFPCEFEFGGSTHAHSVHGIIAIGQVFSYFLGCRLHRIGPVPCPRTAPDSQPMPASVLYVIGFPLGKEPEQFATPKSGGIRL